MRTRTNILLITAVAALFALVPSMAMAADGAPDQMVDPAGAMEPELTDEVEPAPAPEGDGEATAAAANDSVTMDGSKMELGSADAPSGSGSSAPTSTATGYVPVGGGSLPFTGPEDGRIALLLIVGSLLLAGGATAWSLGRVAAPAR